MRTSTPAVWPLPFALVGFGMFAVGCFALAAVLTHRMAGVRHRRAELLSFVSFGCGVPVVVLSLWVVAHP